MGAFLAPCQASEAGGQGVMMATEWHAAGRTAGVMHHGALLFLLKMELVCGADLATRAEARTAIAEPVEVFYHNRRRHPSLGYLFPAGRNRQRTR